MNTDGRRFFNYAGYFKLFLLTLSVLFIAACAGAPLPGETPAAVSPVVGAKATPLPTPPPQTPLAAPAVPPGQIRAPAVAGAWYPDDPTTLAALMDELLAGAKPVEGEPLGLIVPHAGYTYSGPVAAYGFKQLAGVDYDTAVIIAADHQLPLSNPISVWAEGGFKTPLGVVPVDVEVAQALVAADARITFDPTAHEGEHPLEIELPFLQRVCPRCKIVPILMGADDDRTVQALANALIKALDHRRAVVIASSDLSHYPSLADAVRVDGATLAAIETGDPAEVRTTLAASMSAGVPNLATCACGEGPILVTMRVAAARGANTVTLINYANSADSPQGDPAQVVGYGAVMFWRYDPPDLTAARQAELLKLAHAAIASYLDTDQVPTFETDDPVLARPAGAFATLTKNGELRGCIGHMEADTPLVQIVPQMAIAAAVSDPRFPLLTPTELAEIKLEISVLSPLHRVANFDQIQIGTDGLLIKQNGQQGVFLPKVPVEQGWNRDQYLENLCYKASLPGDCWHKNPTLYSFTAVVFGE